MESVIRDFPVEMRSKCASRRTSLRIARCPPEKTCVAPVCVPIAQRCVEDARPIEPREIAKLGTPIALSGGMTYERQRLGMQGEDLACAELERLGYAILARRYRTRFGEIDLVCDDRGTVVFVEVKTKTDCTFSDPVEAVTKQKQRRLVSMAEQYAAYHDLDSTPCRFDVVTVDVSVAPSRITVYQDAFRPGW